MKNPAGSTSRTQRFSTKGAFTLMEILVVITVMALLAGLVAGTAGFVQQKARRSKAVVQLAAIDVGLAKYENDWGEYPEEKAKTNKEIDGSQWNVSGAKMLYQALSGDGSSAIAGVGGGSSNGILGEKGDGEVYMEMLNANNKTQNLVKEDGKDYYLIDPLSHPWQYEKADKRRPGKTNNVTYDLWSYGTWDRTSGESENSPKARAKWIKNW